MNMATWYEICVNITSGQGIEDSSAVGNLDQAKRAVHRFRALYPKAHIIFIRQHMRGHDGKVTNRRYRVLHNLTVLDGTTADERRAQAAAMVAATPRRQQNSQTSTEEG